MTTLPKAVPVGQPSTRRAFDCAACAVRHLTFCAALSDEEVSRIGAVAGHINLGNEEMLFHEGEATNYVFNITTGAVKLYKLLSDGRCQITGFLYPGDFLGLASSKGYSYSAEAIGDVVLCRFTRAKLDALFELYPGMERRLFDFANDELAAAQDQMLLLGRKTAVEKIASLPAYAGRKAEGPRQRYRRPDFAREPRRHRGLSRLGHRDGQPHLDEAQGGRGDSAGQCPRGALRAARGVACDDRGLSGGLKVSPPIDRRPRPRQSPPEARDRPSGR
jgi:CRP-like cAMP-binding protein